MCVELQGLLWIINSASSPYYYFEACEKIAVVILTIAKDVRMENGPATRPNNSPILDSQKLSIDVVSRVHKTDRLDPIVRL